MTMTILKEWHGRGNSIIARFYSCSDTSSNSIRYFIDIDSCTNTFEVTPPTGINNTQVISLLRINGVPMRYIRWIIANFSKLNK